MELTAFGDTGKHCRMCGRTGPNPCDTDALIQRLTNLIIDARCFHKEYHQILADLKDLLKNPKHPTPKLP